LNIYRNLWLSFSSQKLQPPGGFIFYHSNFFAMKRFLLFLSATAMMAFMIVNDPLSEKERNDAVASLTGTRDQLFESVKGLSEAQLKFQPAADKWSVEDCLKHIAVTESGLWQMCDGALKQPANPEKRTEIKVTDE
jgi:DinB superfamily